MRRHVTPPSSSPLKITRIVKKLRKRKRKKEETRWNIEQEDNSSRQDDRKDTCSRVEEEKEKEEEREKKEHRDLERAIRGQGTEPNGEWGLNYRFERILRVCTVARYKRWSCRVCLSAEIDYDTSKHVATTQQQLREIRWKGREGKIEGNKDERGG